MNRFAHQQLQRSRSISIHVHVSYNREANYLQQRRRLLMSSFIPPSSTRPLCDDATTRKVPPFIPSHRLKPWLIQNETLHWYELGECKEEKNMICMAAADQQEKASSQIKSIREEHKFMRCERGQVVVRFSSFGDQYVKNRTSCRHQQRDPFSPFLL